MANRYILDKGQLDRAITSLQMAGMDKEAYLLMEVCDEQYIGKSLEDLYSDISDFATYLFQREHKKILHNKGETQESF